MGAAARLVGCRVGGSCSPTTTRTTRVPASGDPPRASAVLLVRLLPGEVEGFPVARATLVQAAATPRAKASRSMVLRLPVCHVRAWPTRGASRVGIRAASARLAKLGGEPRHSDRVRADGSGAPPVDRPVLPQRHTAANVVRELASDPRARRLPPAWSDRLAFFRRTTSLDQGGGCCQAWILVWPVGALSCIYKISAFPAAARRGDAQPGAWRAARRVHVARAESRQFRPCCGFSC